jgi:hypothetical protein
MLRSRGMPSGSRAKLALWPRVRRTNLLSTAQAAMVCRGCAAVTDTVQLALVQGMRSTAKGQRDAFNVGAPRGMKNDAVRGQDARHSC